ncbi:MAG: MBL fold metallo-hydrolase [Alphaproteobacteria bacterium]|nr:MBL fold metallo-hydrolase [Alphaproteobacteria bacterium]
MKFVTPVVSTIALVIAASLAACAPKPEAAVEAPAETVAPAAAPAIAESADVKPFAIGSLEAAALRDGGMQVPNDNKILAINATKAETAAVLTAAGLPVETLDLSVQPLFVRGAGKLMLFDAGAAGSMGPGAGKLPASLASAGIDAAAVTDIFISHAHGDHVAGMVTAEGALTFPNASVHISAPEWASMQTQAPIAALVAAITPKVVAFEPGADLIPGVVKAVAIDGHTPGHSGYEITSDGQSLLYIGDTMHHSVISVQQPDWTIQFDGDAPVAQASRKALLARAAASGQRIYAVHFPFPGVGKFEVQGDKTVWVAE